ncbi:MAG: hypothetical protein OEQ39_18205 [Gammaproteobacteria bacterium]|nr:hypothetical protein [Gammaproteobacteria bacterium]MDH3469165.1 hypothetical protein [Gammaproteobacteria bacterium]
MQWVLFAIAIAALLLAATRFPKTAYGMLSALLLVVGLLYWRSQGGTDGRELLIPVAHVVISDTVVTQAYRESFNISARITNNSETHTLAEATIEFAMLDCESDTTDESACAILGSKRRTIVIRIPPGQSRDFEDNLSFAGAKIRGHVRWRYSVVHTQAM